jgi:uncharacterized protein YjiS (DUF1127 family)
MRCATPVAPRIASGRVRHIKTGGPFWTPIRGPVSTPIDSCAERSIMFHDKLRTARLLAQLDSDMLEDIGVPHDQRSQTSGMLNRYPNVIKVQRSSI